MSQDQEQEYDDPVVDLQSLVPPIRYFEVRFPDPKHKAVNIAAHYVSVIDGVLVFLVAEVITYLGKPTLARKIPYGYRIWSEYEEIIVKGPIANSIN